MHSASVCARWTVLKVMKHIRGQLKQEILSIFFEVHYSFFLLFTVFYNMFLNSCYILQRDRSFFQRRLKEKLNRVRTFDQWKSVVKKCCSFIFTFRLFRRSVCSEVFPRYVQQWILVVLFICIYIVLWFLLPKKIYDR